MGEKREVGRVEYIWPRLLHPVHKLLGSVSHLEMSLEEMIITRCLAHLVIPVTDPHQARQVGGH